jgi:glutathione synthase/RimK-type ligase-like ATP-grasp enzyme
MLTPTKSVVKTMSAKIHVLHENHEWTVHLTRELDALGIPYVDWHLDQGLLDLSSSPPEGVFYNRMSASSHTRGHRYAPEYTAAVLAWLEAHQRKVINPTSALRFEVSKVAQYAALEAHGIDTPKTIAVVGMDQLLEAASAFDGPFITKHNRAGKGLGVRLFNDLSEFEQHVSSGDWEPSVDGIMLIQQYIQPPEPFITRLEFIGGKYLYALKVDTSDGFLLCPADGCSLPDPERVKFEVLADFHHTLIAKCEAFMRVAGIDVAGIEFIVDRDGKPWVYDINTNTNYNSEAEQKVGKNAMKTLATYLGKELQELSAEDNWKWAASA